MCIIHDESCHNIFQNMMLAFEKSKMLTTIQLSRLGCLICTCKSDLFYDSKTLIQTQRDLFKWFDESIQTSSLDQNNNQNQQQPLKIKSSISIERLLCFKSLIDDDLKHNGQVDSGTKITFLNLLKDLDSFDYSKLKHFINLKSSSMTTTTTKTTNYNIYLFVKIVSLKIDLKLCSTKEFVEMLNSLDNCALKYVELVNKCKIMPRRMEHLKLRNILMGELECTIEAKSEKALKRAELNLKRLADSIHYRLAKQKQKSFQDQNQSIQQQSPLSTDISTTTTNDENSIMNDQSTSDLASSSSSSSSNDVKTKKEKQTGQNRRSRRQRQRNNNNKNKNNNESSSNNNNNNSSSFLSTSTLNDDNDDSILDFDGPRRNNHNKKNNNRNHGSTTPLTSSPISSSYSCSSSSSPTSLRQRFKLTIQEINDNKFNNNNKNNKKNEKKRQRSIVATYDKQ
jgi:hypothetical protein